MFEYLQPRDGPVIDGLEQYEIVFGKDQPEYNPLRALRANTPDGNVLSRWTLTAEQRKAIADGADVFLELLTFTGPLQPIRLIVADAPNPEYFEGVYQLSTPAGPPNPPKQKVPMVG